jgi:hypothetical protein
MQRNKTFFEYIFKEVLKGNIRIEKFSLQNEHQWVKKWEVFINFFSLH